MEGGRKEKLKNEFLRSRPEESRGQRSLIRGEGNEKNPLKKKGLEAIHGKQNGRVHQKRLR